ncbi:MAG TPA: D-alanine--D-alanine ligase [Gemmatimonadaceae bacterium]|nr:D-alanine--D-alanine ligase [Gemmatimonadaceae bacterium]
MAEKKKGTESAAPLKVTVLMGGASSERDVSFASGTRVAAALRERGHTVTAFDPAGAVLSADEEKGYLSGAVKKAPPTPEFLATLKIPGSLGEHPAVRGADVVFLGLHGGQGEDGTVQALLDLAGITYTGSGHLASALAMDKDLSKLLFRAAGVRTADWLMAPASDDEIVAALGLPVVVKPSKQGSTVGLSVVKRREELAAAIALAYEHDDEVMIEAFVPGRELTVGILGGDALAVGEIIPKHEIYDYECKYTAGMAVEEFPAKLDRAQTGAVQQQALAAFRALKLGGYARIDFRMSPEGHFYCLEANTLPGMTETSLIPQSAEACGIGFGELCERVVRLALESGRR